MTNQEILRFAELTGKLAFEWCPDGLHNIYELANLFKKDSDLFNDEKEWLELYNRLKD